MEVVKSRIKRRPTSAKSELGLTKRKQKPGDVIRSAKEEARGFLELAKELEKRNILEQKLKRVERKLEKAAKALLRKRGIGSARSSAKNLPPPSWRPIDPNYIMNSVQVAPLMSSGYGNTARFRTHYDATITRTAECDEAPRMKELNMIIDNGPHGKVAAEFTTFAEAAAQLGINLCATGHDTAGNELQ
jgi:hypothetical protein